MRPCVARAIIRIFENPERWSVALIEAQRVHDAVPAPHVKWGRMARIRVDHTAIIGVDDQVKGRGQHRSLRLAEDCAQAAVDLSHKAARVGSHRCELFDESAHDRCHECGPQPVPDHVANENARLVVRKREHAKEISTHTLRRPIAMTETQPAFLGAAPAGKLG